MKPRKERLVIKVGTRVLTRENQQLDYNVVHQIVAQIGTLRREGHQVVLVSSGAAGASHGLADFRAEHRSLLRRQLMTSVGQPRLMSLYTDFFREHQITVAQALLTRYDFGDRERYVNIRNVMEGLLDLDVLPILNENDVVTSEALTFGDNDYLAAAVSSTISATRLFLLTVGDGFYAGGDPNRNPAAKLLHDVREITPEMWESCQATISTGGSGGMFSKLKAVDMATSFGIESHILSGKEVDVVPRVLAGERIGTRFAPKDKRVKGYRQWLRFGAMTNGRIYVDAGAERALANNKSLLPAGISRAEGSFQPGDIVEIFGAADEKLGVGLINFSADDLNAMLAGNRKIERSAEAIHKDRLLLA